MLLSLFLGVANIKTVELIISNLKQLYAKLNMPGSPIRQSRPSKGNANPLIVECEMTNEFYFSPNNLP
jgi:hypothetical protein